jgi:hypothetical protein
MHVVEREHERPLRGQGLQQRADRTVSTNPLARQHRPRRHAGRPQRREDPGQLRRHVRVQAARPLVALAQVPIERVDDDPERHVVLELRPAGAQHARVTAAGELAQPGQHRRLADARLTDELEEHRAVRKPADGFEQRDLLDRTANQPRGVDTHGQARILDRPTTRRKRTGATELTAGAADV